MAKIIKVASWSGNSKAHVIFIHGLGGHAYDTWQVTNQSETFWPVWLSKDNPGFNTWTIDYDAPITNWLGNSLPLQDRAVNILALIMSEPELQDVPIAFVCHSLGGLVLKQVLKEAVDQSARDEKAKKFLENVKGVVFAATPHTGAKLAKTGDTFRLLIWPSNSISDLARNDPNLRNLNKWYRNWPNDIHNEIFYETHSTAAGMVVDPTSADAGLPGVVPIPIEKNHTQIVKPETRDDLVYKRTNGFLTDKVFKTTGKNSRVKNKNTALEVFDRVKVKEHRSINPIPIILRLLLIAFLAFGSYKVVEHFFFPPDPVKYPEVVEIINQEKQISQDYASDLELASKSLNASQQELTSLLRFILDKHIPQENIQQELAAAYERLKELRDGFSDLSSLSENVPEIAPLLKEANDALQAGDGFSLDKADEALALADQRYLEIISERNEQLKQDKLNRARILIKRAEIAEVKFDYKTAEGFYEAELALQIEVNGEVHLDTAASYNNVAYNLNAQGKYKQAEPQYRKALEIKESILDKEHPDTTASYNNLAYNLDDQGKYDEAEPLYRKALEIKKSILREEHPSIATGYNNLALNLNAQGKYDEAEPLLRKALEIRERILGEEHPITAQSYNNLAYSLNAQGKYDEAEPLYRKALEIKERILGEEHPSTATGYNNLASNLDDQGRYDDAEPLYRKALEIAVRNLGEEHPNTKIFYNNLAKNLDAQGKHEEAEEIRKKIEK